MVSLKYTWTFPIFVTLSLAYRFANPALVLFLLEIIELTKKDFAWLLYLIAMSVLTVNIVTIALILCHYVSVVRIGNESRPGSCNGRGPKLLCW